MKVIDFDKLIHSITYWLSYQERIGRNFMIQESSLKYPVADYLTGLGTPIEYIGLEYSHPQLKSRRIDLVTADSPLSYNTHKIQVAIEFKIANYLTKYEPEQKRIFNDLMRMYFVNKNNNTSSYFIICGKHNEFIQNFRSIPTRKPTQNTKHMIPDPDGFYSKKWFGFGKNEEMIFLVEKETNNTYKKIYTNFLNEYSPRDNSFSWELPKKITTKCIAISRFSRVNPTPYVGSIWKIQ